MSLLSVEYIFLQEIILQLLQPHSTMSKSDGSEGSYHSSDCTSTRGVTGGSSRGSSVSNTSASCLFQRTPTPEIVQSLAAQQYVKRWNADPKTRTAGERDESGEIPGSYVDESCDDRSEDTDSDHEACEEDSSASDEFVERIRRVKTLANRSATSTGVAKEEGPWDRADTNSRDASNRVEHGNTDVKNRRRGKVFTSKERRALAQGTAE